MRVYFYLVTPVVFSKFIASIVPTIGARWTRRNVLRPFWWSIYPLDFLVPSIAIVKRSRLCVDAVQTVPQKIYTVVLCSHS